MQPGTPAGGLRASVCEELGIGAIPVIAVAEHDTGSAVAAVPARRGIFAYLSCGTWSLMGTEVDRPVMNELAQELNFTNEGGVGGTFRLLKNIMGLWILQECRETWERAGQSYPFPELVALAEQAKPFARSSIRTMRCSCRPATCRRASRDIARHGSAGAGVEPARSSVAYWKAWR